MRFVAPGEALRVRRRDRGLRRGHAADVAAAWRRAVRPLPVEGLTPGPGARRLLVLPKVGGSEDVVATLSGRGDVGLELVQLDRAEVKAAFRALIGPGHDRLTDLDYRPDDGSFDAAKAHTRGFLAEVMHRLRDELDLAGVIGANVTYYAERELAGACTDVELPFLVLHKESIRSPLQREAFTRAYRTRTGAFTGQAVAVYNASERASQVDAGIVADATVVGCPRVDALHAWRRARASGADADRIAGTGPVVLFAIDPRAGTWTPFDRDGDRTPMAAPRWERLAHETEAAFLDLARAHPQHPFVIKAKVGHGERLQARLPEGLPRNVRVVTDGTATDLVTRAAVAIAFNTTVVAEALAAGLPVVVPAFAEAAQPGSDAWLHPYGDAVHRVRAPEDLGAAVIAAQRSGRSVELDDTSVRVLEELIGNADGQASDRAWAWLAGQLGGGAASR